MDFNMPNGINCLKYQTESQTLIGKLCKFKNGKIKWMLEKKQFQQTFVLSHSLTLFAKIDEIL